MKVGLLPGVIIAFLCVILSLTGSCNSANETAISIPSISPEAVPFTVPSVAPGGRLPSITVSSAPGSLTPVSTSSSSPQSSSTAGAPFGKLYMAGPFKVIDLYGNYYQMGREYGAILKGDLLALYPAVVNEYLIQMHKLTMEDIRAWVDPRYDLFPENLKQFLQGEADATGIELEKLIILANFTDLARIVPSSVGCSGIAAWGEYTSGEPMIYGRNFDWWGHYAYFDSYIVVTVFHPADGGYPFASVAWAGELLLQTGLNSAGLFIESNDGEISGGATFLDNVIHPSIQVIDILEKSASTQQFHELFKNTPQARAMTMNVADKDGAYSYECTLESVKRREPDKNGLLVVTNHFVDPSWTGLRVPNDVFQTETRRNNLLTLAEKYKGLFSPDMMARVLDTSIENGGATQTNTIYQVICSPTQQILWIKAQGYSDWVEVDLKSLLSNP